jgi:transcriptional regulator with XRE-family HTH domain
MYVGKWIKKQLEKLNISQVELSKNVDKSRQAVSNWIAGRFPPTRDDIIRISMFIASKGKQDFGDVVLGLMLEAQKDLRNRNE